MALAECIAILDCVPSELSLCLNHLDNTQYNNMAGPLCPQPHTVMSLTQEQYPKPCSQAPEFIHAELQDQYVSRMLADHQITTRLTAMLFPLFCAGLQITDASSFADYIPSEAAHTSNPATTPAPFADPSLPLPAQQPTSARASTSTPLVQPQQQHAGVGHTPHGTPVLPDTSLRGASSFVQHRAANGQGTHFSGQKMPERTSQNTVAAQQPSSSGQQLPFGMFPIPFSTQKGQCSGQKRPASRLDGPSASKISRQITLDASLQSRSTTSGASAGKESDRSNTGTPSGTGMMPLHWSKGGQALHEQQSVQRANQHWAAASPGAGVAQVLDLTQADEGLATGTGTDQHDGLPWSQPPVELSVGNGRGNRLQPCGSSDSPSETANVVDLT